jgi:hypothetical protein
MSLIVYFILLLFAIGILCRMLTCVLQSLLVRRPSSQEGHTAAPRARRQPPATRGELSLHCCFYVLPSAVYRTPWSSWHVLGDLGPGTGRVELAACLDRACGPAYSIMCFLMFSLSLLSTALARHSKYAIHVVPFPQVASDVQISVI